MWIEISPHTPRPRARVKAHHARCATCLDALLSRLQSTPRLPNQRNPIFNQDTKHSLRHYTVDRVWTMWGCREEQGIRGKGQGYLLHVTPQPFLTILILRMCAQEFRNVRLPFGEFGHSLPDFGAFFGVVACLFDVSVLLRRGEGGRGRGCEGVLVPCIGVQRSRL